MSHSPLSAAYTHMIFHSLFSSACDTIPCTTSVQDSSRTFLNVTFVSEQSISSKYLTQMVREDLS